MRNISDLFKLTKTEGDFGVEVELEAETGDSLEKVIKDPHLTPFWRFEADGSLRGHSVEAVFRTPMSFQYTKMAIENLEHSVNNNKFIDTGRAGTHVHINMQDYTITQVFNAVCLYLLFEVPIVDMCGKDRVGNLFCLRAQDAEESVHLYRKVIQSRNWRRLHDDSIRYSSLNLSSLPKYGSLEFRAMGSTVDTELLCKWVKVIGNIREVALTFSNPMSIIQEFSRGGPEALFNSVSQGIIEYPEDEECIFDGLSLAQYLAYSTDWEELEKEEARLDKNREALIRILQELIKKLDIDEYENTIDEANSTLFYYKNTEAAVNDDALDNQIDYIRAYIILDEDNKELEPSGILDDIIEEVFKEVFNG